MLAMLLLCGALVPLLANAGTDLERHPAASTNDPIELRGAVEEDTPTPDQEPTASQLRRQLDEAKRQLADLQRRLEEMSATNESTHQEIAARKARAEEESLANAALWKQRLAELEAQRARLAGEDAATNSDRIKDIAGLERELKLKLEASGRLREAQVAKSKQDLEGLRKQLAFKEEDRERQVLASEVFLQKTLEGSRRELELLKERYTEESPELLKKTAAVRALEEKVANADGRVAQRNPNENVIYMATGVALQIGNTITVELRGENGRFSLPNLAIAADGAVTLPWVGSVKVSGLTLQQCEEKLLKSLATHPDLIDGKPVKAVVVTVVRKGE
jgi:hypothetical protein